MSTLILSTKLFIPPRKRKVVLRPRLMERLNEGLRRKITLISAPAGYGKTSLVCEWIAGCERKVAWLSIDDEHNDITFFLAYLIAAVQTVHPDVGVGISKILRSPQPPSTKSILTQLLNEIAAVPEPFTLVFDDYHLIEANEVNRALTYLVEHLPPQLHLLIATREDPQLPLSRYRTNGQLGELRAADLRFSSSEAARFLNRVMGLSLPKKEITALATRTEGWIAGLQLAAISVRGHRDAALFIRSFTGGHHFVMDYLMEEVLQQQKDSIQAFLLRTAILDRMCGPLCDAVMQGAPGNGQSTLERLEKANLFVVPMDDERRWYRYHHLFADLLRQRLDQGAALPHETVAEYHIRASQWLEDNGFSIEAFHHATAAHDFDRAIRLIDLGKGIPLHFRGVVIKILNWLASLPNEVLDARPSLLVRYASLLLVNGQTTGVEEKLQAAEAALQDTGMDDQMRNLNGQIATARATLALTRYQAESMLEQSRRALVYLHPDNTLFRANANWTMGYAHLWQRNLDAARSSFTEAISLSQRSGDIFRTILATIGLGAVDEAENRLPQAAETYQQVLQLAGDQPLQIINEAHLGMARILYEWNDLDTAEQHGNESLHLAQQYDKAIDRSIIGEVFLGRLKLARGDLDGAAAILARASQSVRQYNFVHRMVEVVAVQVLVLIQQGNLAAAQQLAQGHELPISRVRVLLAQGDASSALALLQALRAQTDAENRHSELLEVTVLQAIALFCHGEENEALEVLEEALEQAEPGGFVRTFVDEGSVMAKLISAAAAKGLKPDYTGKLLAAFAAEREKEKGISRRPSSRSDQPHFEQLSRRELEVLQLIAQGLSNREIGDRLYLELSTVKGHNQKIFAKLAVKRRTEAVARARELGLL